MWNTFIIGWNPQGEKAFEHQVFYKEDYHNKVIHLAVGNLTPHPGDEIVIGHHYPDELRLYSWNGASLTTGPLYPLGHKHIAITNVYIVDADQGSDSSGEVVICGTGYEEEAPESSGRFYLEVLGYNEGFFSKWRKLGGDVGMIRVSYAAINKNNN
jgi:hypothetical protein